MELIDILRILRRWAWLIVVIVIVTELALWLGMRSIEPVYSATVSLQISAPQREEVAAYDEYRAISLRDEITIAINNFVELLQNDEVRQRTIQQLGFFEQDDHYTITAEQIRDSDFINVTAEARSPDLAAKIANKHTAVAIAYFGELRAKSTTAEKELFAKQLRVAEKNFHSAEDALAEFRTLNDIFLLESQISTQQKLLEQLQLERDQILLEKSKTVITATDTDAAVQVTATPAIDPVAEVDKLIAQRMKELDRFTALAPQYNILIQNVAQARSVYQHLLEKYSEADLKVTAVQAANFIQVIKPAYAPVGSESGWARLALLVLAGSLGLGVMLAFFLEYISSFRRSRTVVPASDHKTSSHRHRKRLSQGPVSRIPATEQKIPAREYLGRGLWIHFRKIFHLHDRSSITSGEASSSDHDAVQEPVAVQSQHGATDTKIA